VTRPVQLPRGSPENLEARSGFQGRRLVPTKLAQLSVKGAGLAIALVSVHVSVHGVIAREFVAARLVGSGIDNADTGIVGVCLCWWNAEGSCTQGNGRQDGQANYPHPSRATVTPP
jgi:hypothetical protein